MKIKTVISKEVIEAAEREGVNIESWMRDLLKLPPLPGSDGWLVKGVYFPKGTYFRCWWKDRPYWGEVRDGGLWIKDQKFTSPSEATNLFTSPPVNGWRVWECKMPGKRDWVPIFDLRSSVANAETVE